MSSIGRTGPSGAPILDESSHDSGIVADSSNGASAGPIIDDREVPEEPIDCMDGPPIHSSDPWSYASPGPILEVDLPPGAAEPPPPPPTPPGEPERGPGGGFILD